MFFVVVVGRRRKLTDKVINPRVKVGLRRVESFFGSFLFSLGSSSFVYLFGRDVVLSFEDVKIVGGLYSSEGEKDAKSKGLEDLSYSPLLLVLVPFQWILIVSFLSFFLFFFWVLTLPMIFSHNSTMLSHSVCGVGPI